MDTFRRHTLCLGEFLDCFHRSFVQAWNGSVAMYFVRCLQRRLIQTVFVWCFLHLCFVGTVSGLLSQEMVDTSDGSSEIASRNRETMSILDVSRGYAKALEEFDVLIRVRTSFDTVRQDSDMTGMTKDSESFYRVSVDFRRRRGQWLLARKENGIVFPADSQATPFNFDQESFQLVIVDHGKDKYLAKSAGQDVFEDSVSVLRNTDGNFWGNAMVRDVRLLPLLAGDEFDIPTPEMVELLSRSYDNLHIPIKRSVMKSGNTVIEFDFRSDNDTTYRTRYEFEAVTDLMVSRVVTSWPSSNPLSKPKKLSAIDQTCWEEQNSVFVPTKIIVDVPATYTVNGGQSETGMKRIIYDLHWLAVNAPIDEEVFLTARQARDEHESRKRLDPRKVGAKRLVHEVESETTAVQENGK